MSTPSLCGEKREDQAKEGESTIPANESGNPLSHVLTSVKLEPQCKILILLRILAFHSNGGSIDEVSSHAKGPQSGLSVRVVDGC